MDDPPSTPTGRSTETTVVVADEQSDVPVDAARYAELARAVLEAEQRRGELTLTFVDAQEMAALNAEYMGADGPTDVLAWPLDADAPPHELGATGPDIPLLLGDVVVCPAVAAEAAPSHAGTLDDELALLVVHGVLHVLGHDHHDPEDTARMRARELELLTQLHWHGPAPAGFTQEQEPHR